MNENPNQPIIGEKTMIEDKKNRPIPQYYDVISQDFHPNTGGEEMTPSGSSTGNPFQPDFSSTTLLVDKKGRPIPQFYSVDDGFFYPMTSDYSGGGGGGPSPTGGVRTVNLKSPDLNGNVNTDFHVIEPIGPDIPPSGYPMGTTEFYSDYDPANYVAYIAANPSMAKLQKGRICVRTFRKNGFAYQQVDNVRDGIFDAAYVRVNIDISNWGELSVVGGSGGSGTPGPQGPQGEQGPKGDKGDTGQQGPQGPQGPKGDKGDKGDVGEQGLPGVDGIDGDKGDKGDTGPQGPAGPKGDDGAQGPKGDKGEPGDIDNLPKASTTQEGIVRLTNEVTPGDSESLALTQKGANNLYQQNNILAMAFDDHMTHIASDGNLGTIGHVKPDGITITADEEGVISAIGGSGAPGPQGPKGDTGPQGPQGIPGTNGTKGDKGDTGDTGPQGPNGDAGPQGPAGADGQDGLQGPKGDKGDKGDTGATGPKGDKGDPGDPLQIANNLTTTVAGKALDATQGKKLADDLTEHVEKIASTTELGHVKVDGTSVKMNDNDQLYVDIGDLPIPIQINNEYFIDDSPTTYPVGHTITMLGSDDPGFADLISEFNLDYDIELTSLNTRFIVQTVKNKNNMTHQTAQAITNNRGSLLGTMYRFSQSIYYGFSSWYSQTHTLVGRGAPGDQGRGEGISGNLYVNSITGKVYAKVGYDKTVGYTNWRVVGPTVVNNSYSPVVDDDDTVYNAYTVDQMFTNVNNELATLGGESATHMAQIMNLNTDLSDHMMTRTTNESMGHAQADGTSITANNGIISAKTKLNRIWDSRPIAGNAPTWTVDYSDEPDLTDLNNYDFEVYDDGVLVFGNPITHVVDNVNKTVTFTPQTPMSRPFTITCIGRGMEFE